MRGGHRVLYTTVWLLASALPATLMAQQAPKGIEREGLIVQVLDDRVIVDIGSAQGVLPGDPARILSAGAEGDSRKGRAVLGTSRVDQVGEAMCQVPLGDIDPARVRVGDVVRITVRGDEVPAVGAVAGTAAARPQRTAPRESPERVVAALPRSRIAHEPLQDLVHGRSVMVTIVAVGPNAPAEATVFVRSRRGGDFVAFPMARTGDAGWTTTLDSLAVRAPRIEYFIEGVSEDGRQIPLFRSQGRPWAVTVRDDGVTRGPSVRIGGTFEWQEFHLSNPNRDAFWRASADFAYRLNRGAVAELRGGVGMLEGIGGPRNAVEDGWALDHRALAWLYFEPVLRFGDWVRMYPRIMLGGFITFVDQDFESWAEQPEKGSAMFGTSLHMEIGREQGVVIRFGGTILQSVGAEMDAQLTFQAARGVPIGLSVSATNFPVAEEWGARVQLLAGYRALDWLAIDLRLGANIRTTRHAGVGGGLGLSFAW